VILAGATCTEGHTMGGENFVIYVNTALLIFVAGLIIGFGRWLVTRVYALDKQVSENCLKITDIKETVERHSGELVVLRLGIATHTASPHCGEENA